MAFGIQIFSNFVSRSKTELQKHLDEHRLPHSVDQFDFSLDDRLKRLRQIWKQYIINADIEKVFSRNMDHPINRQD